LPQFAQRRVKNVARGGQQLGEERLSGIARRQSVRNVVGHLGDVIVGYSHRYALFDHDLAKLSQRPVLELFDRAR
jgi:hypothetical protein